MKELVVEWVKKAERRCRHSQTKGESKGLQNRLMRPTEISEDEV
jgi:hypothetical protein